MGCWVPVRMYIILSCTSLWIRHARRFPGTSYLRGRGAPVPTCCFGYRDKKSARRPDKIRLIDWDPEQKKKSSPAARSSRLESSFAVVKRQDFVAPSRAPSRSALGDCSHNWFSASPTPRHISQHSAHCAVAVPWLSREFNGAHNGVAQAERIRRCDRFLPPERGWLRRGPTRGHLVPEWRRCRRGRIRGRRRCLVRIRRRWEWRLQRRRWRWGRRQRRRGGAKRRRWPRRHGKAQWAQLSHLDRRQRRRALRVRRDWSRLR